LRPGKTMRGAMSTRVIQADEGGGKVAQHVRDRVKNSKTGQSGRDFDFPVRENSKENSTMATK